SLGRIAMVGLTDRFGGHLMFPLVSMITVIAVLFLGFFGQYTYPILLVGRLFLAIGGVTVAIGVPDVYAWFRLANCRLATGPHALTVYAIVGCLFTRNAPTWEPSRKNILAQSAAVMTLKVT